MSHRNDPKVAQPYFHANHRRPMTRRDLLAQGFLTMGAYVAMPSILTLLSRTAMGQEGMDALKCSAESAARMVPFIVIDLAGGANIAGTNVIVGQKGGQSDFLPAGSYGTIGLAPEAEPTQAAPNSELGLLFQPQSKMLQGIKEFAQATTIANVDGALFCTASGDDTRNNPHNPLYWIAKTGLGGELVSLIGSSDGASGGRAAAPNASIDPSLQPARITRPGDVLGLVDPGKLARLLSSADVMKILNATKTMSDSRLMKFAQKDLPSQVRDLVRCGYVNSNELLSNSSDTAKFDPAQDTAISTVFPAIATDGSQQTAGSIAKMVLDGYAGAGVIEMGGYDYHGQGRATQDARDLDAGRMIGRILEAAALKQQNVMIYVYTDGGVSSSQAGAVNGIFPFASDSGERSAAFTLVYKAAGGRPAMRDDARQIGAFKAGGSVDQSVNKISSSVENLTKAIVANYLALHGREGDFAKVVGTDPFGADLAAYLAFQKMV